jgi:hypothetical protein
MTKKRIKEDSSSSEPVVLATPAKSEPVVLATATKSKKIKIEKEEIVDLTGDPQFIDSAEGYDPDWKSSRPASPMQPPKSTTYQKPGKYMRPTAKLGATSKPVARGYATSSATSSDTVESCTYGKKRGRGFVQEESSESEDSSKEESEDSSEK